MKEIEHLRFLVFKMGGIAGAIRRIIREWQGVFTAGFIRVAMKMRYPVLIPGPTQIEDLLERLEKFQRIRCVFVSGAEKVFQYLSA